MNNVISKELLSEVLGNGIYTHVSLDNCVVSWNNAKEDESINIYELANKCKEWAVVKQFYNIATLLDYTGHTCIIRQDPITFLNTELRFRAGTEPDAIFKACQWILDNKEQ